MNIRSEIIRNGEINMTEDEERALLIFETVPAKGLWVIASIMAEILNVPEDDALIAMAKTYARLNEKKKREIMK